MYTKNPFLNLLSLVLLLLSFFARAETITLPEREPGVWISDQSIHQRVCYYDDKAYSLGAVIKVGNILLECVAEKSFESNGKLKWQQSPQKSEQ